MLSSAQSLSHRTNVYMVMFCLSSLLLPGTFTRLEKAGIR
jgi:hypothetical protein